MDAVAGRWCAVTWQCGALPLLLAPQPRWLAECSLEAARYLDPVAVFDAIGWPAHHK